MKTQLNGNSGGSCGGILWFWITERTVEPFNKSTIESYMKNCTKMGMDCRQWKFSLLKEQQKKEESRGSEKRNCKKPVREKFMENAEN